MPSRLRRRAPLVLTALVAVAIAVPATAFGIHQFTDVPDSNPFHADIDAVADRGVTTGCGGTNYCPKDFVTREQMAAFMNRLGALSGSKTPVVNADRLDGMDSMDFLPASTITMTQIGGWTTSNLTTRDSDTGTLLTATGGGVTQARVGLHGPATIGGFGYALQSVEVCFSAGAGVTLTQVLWHQVTGSEITDGPHADGTDTLLTSPHCRTVTDPTPEISGTHAYTLRANFDFTDPASWTITTIRTTWALVAAVA